MSIVILRGLLSHGIITSTLFRGLRLGIIIIGLSMTSISSAWGQDSDSTTVKLDPLAILQVAGISGSVSAAVTVALEFYSHSKKVAKERQQKEITDKVSLYSNLIFYLRLMKKNPDFASGGESQFKIENTIKEIDGILFEKFHLIDDELGNKWFDLRYSLKSGTRSPADVAKLLNLLIKTYNDELRVKYKKIMGTAIKSRAAEPGP